MSDEFNQESEYEIVSPSALDVIQRAEIDLQIATARRFPRNLAKVKQRMLDFATLDEDTAMSCFYTLRRKESGGGTKLIQGPGIRLAEIAVACYGNLRAGARVIGHDDKHVTAQGICHDLEVNSLVTMESLRRITNNKGNIYNDDMIAITGNAAAAIAFRNAVFKVVPGALIKPVYEAARACAVGDAKTLKAKRAKVFERLEAIGVDMKRALRAVDKTDLENVGLEDLATLIGLGTSIKDSDMTIEEAFPEERGSHDDSKRVAAEKIAKNLGYTVEQVLDCIDAKDVGAALKAKYPKDTPKTETKTEPDSANEARDNAIKALAAETGYTVEQVSEFMDSKSFRADIEAKYGPAPKEKKVEPDPEQSRGEPISGKKPWGFDFSK